MHRPAQLDKLESAQRTAMKAILGTFRTTSTPALEIESSLHPTHLRLRTKILKSLIRMQTCPPTNPIRSSIQRAAKSQSKVHTTTLEHLTKTFPQYDPCTIETIYPYPKPPWWTPSFTNSVNGDKKTAKNTMMKQFTAQTLYASTLMDPVSTATLEQWLTVPQRQPQSNDI